MIYNTLTQKSGLKINGAEKAEVLSGNSIKIGDVVYYTNIGAEPFDFDLQGNTYVFGAAFSPDGKLLAIGGNFNGKAKLYSVNGETITYISDIYADNNGTALTYGFISMSFSPDGKLFAGGSILHLMIYSVNGTQLSFLEDITYSDSLPVYNVSSVEFSPDGKLLVVGGQFNGKAKLYSVNGETITYISDIYADNNGTALSAMCTSAKFSPSGDILVVASSTSGLAKVYSVSGASVTYINDIPVNTGEEDLVGNASFVLFNNAGNVLLLSGLIRGAVNRGFVKAYTVNGNTVTFDRDIINETGVNATLPSRAAFSNDDSAYILACDTFVRLYSVSGVAFTYVEDIQPSSPLNNIDGVFLSPNGNPLIFIGNNIAQYHLYKQLGNYSASLGPSASGITAINSIDFSPDGKYVVVGGGYSDKAKLFSVNGKTLTLVLQIRDIPSGVSVVKFTLDGNYLFIGGASFGLKMYSVNGESITYLKDIYSGNNSNILDSAPRAVEFTSDGKTMIVAGEFTGKAKLYSITGNTVTYVSDIYAGNNGTAFSRGNIYTVDISANDSVLVLGGSFTGKAKAYSLYGNTVTYIGDIPSDGSNKALNGDVNDASFNPNGDFLVLTGIFAGYAKLYSVNGTEIKYLSDIPFDGSGIAYSQYVRFAIWMLNGEILILGGSFTDYARLYTFDDSSVSFVEAIDGVERYLTVCAVSPDSKLCVLGSDRFNFYICSVEQSLIISVGEPQETAYAVTDNTYMADADTFIGIAESNAENGEKVSTCKILKLSFQ